MDHYVIMSEKYISERSGETIQPSEKHTDREQYAGLRGDGASPSESLSIEIGTAEDQVFSMSDIDPVLDAKMRLVNKV